MIATSEDILIKVQEEVEKQLALLPRKEIATKALENSLLILVHDKTEAMALCNAYAPEHLIISTDDYESLSTKVINAGSVFLGPYACESAGDYASGTNHTLPTHGYALAYNGVNLDSYCRKITFQYLSEAGVKSIGHAVEVMAANEQLYAHQNAMTLRIKDIENK
jgi:histidinol dehydrogenase